MTETLQVPAVVYVSVELATEHPAAELGASNAYVYAPVPDPPVPLRATVFWVADHVAEVVDNEIAP